MRPAARAILRATMVAGTLDILSAFAFSAMVGIAPAAVLRFVASGPFGDAMLAGGFGAAVLGLLTHFALMAVMAAVFVRAWLTFPAVRRHALLAGLAYGFAIYLVMYWGVRPIRWWGAFPSLTLWAIGNALFSHLVCVGLPIALVTARTIGREGTSGGAAP